MLQCLLREFLLQWFAYACALLLLNEELNHISHVMFFFEIIFQIAND